MIRIDSLLQTASKNAGENVGGYRRLTKTATTAPRTLFKAHQALDRAVDRCYRKEPFESDRQRVEFLFALYQKLTAPLIPAAKVVRARKRLERVASRVRR